MVHPDLTRALAATHVEDLHRDAERDRQIRLARHVRHKPRAAASLVAVLRSASIRLRGRRAPADVMTRTEVPQEALRPCQSVADVRSVPQAGIDRAESRAGGATARPPAKAHNLAPDRTAAGRLALRRPPRSAG